MTKLHLSKNEITLKIHSDVEKPAQIIEIRSGIYKSKTYASLIISDKGVMLEGEDILVLSSDPKAVIIQVKNPIMKLAELLKNDNIYIEGIVAIPSGKERELLEALITGSTLRDQ